MKRTRIVVVLVTLISLAIGWRVLVQPDLPVSAPSPAAINARDGRLTYTTPNTMRLAGANVHAAATAVTQTTYGATQHEDRPHAITLVRADRQTDAMLDTSRITHFPVNSPTLHVDADRLPPETLAEMKRLGNDGNTCDSNVQVLYSAEFRGLPLST